MTTVTAAIADFQHETVPAEEYPTEMVDTRPLAERTFWGLLRLTLGWIFLFPFLDKLFGLYFTTKPASSWLNGGDPTYGFLTFGTKGPFADLYAGMAGSAIVEWLFMIGLVMIGMSLMAGIGVRVSAVAGTMMLVMMYLAAPPWAAPYGHNWFLDEHLVYALVLLTMLVVPAGRYLGLGKWFESLTIVKKMPWLA